MAAIVQFDNVGLRYGTGAETLAGISLSLAAGSFHFLTGSSGAGKTSLLNLITLVTRPSRGIVRIFGEDAGAVSRGRLSALRRRIGMVHQDSRLIPQLTARDNVALPLRIVGMPDRNIAPRVAEMLDWVGLGQRADAYPATLSSGEQQRVAIARAVIAHPDLIVADEPTGNVDQDMAGRILLLFERLNRQGTTILVATHDPYLVARMPEAGVIRLVRGHIEDAPASTHPSPHETVA
jgi:cell division transport system ATP-binding protein